MSGDTHPTQPLPDPAAQWVLSQPDASPRRRGPWLWIVTVLIVAALAVGAWFLAEFIARQLVTQTIRDQVVTNLSLPADQQIDVDLSGQVLPQLIGGTLDDVTIASDDVPLGADTGDITGDITVHATGVPVRGGGQAASADGTVALDLAQLQTLLATVDGFPAQNIGLAAPDVTVSTEISVFGASVPLGISLTPSVSDGDLVLTPGTVQVGGTEVAADALADLIGPLARTIVRPWDVCVAQYLPAGVTLTSVAVEGELVVATADIDGAIVSDTGLQEKGTCA